MKKTFLNSAHLRILALGLMLLDHLWATIVPGNDWMTFLGRMAFPIFAFQAAEGYIIPTTSGATASAWPSSRSSPKFPSI